MEPQQQFLSHQHQQQQPPQQQQGELVDPDEMQHMWQFLDSTLTTGTTPNGLPPQQTVGAPMMHAQYAPPPNAISSGGSVHPDAANVSAMMHAGASMPPHLQARQISDEMREAPLNDDDNGMYNELGDVFSMFFNIDSDESQPQHVGAGTAAALAHAQQMQSGGSFVGAPRYAPTTSSSGNSGAMGADNSAKVQLARSVSASSSHSGLESISPGTGYPSMSPATMNWLQSLGKSSSSDSLMGLVSPATLYGTPGTFPGSAGANSLADGTDLLERTPSCEMIDWKAYNEAGEKTQKEAAPKWRVIPQHGPHADATAAPSVSGFASVGLSAKPPTGSAPPPPQQQSAGEHSHAGDGGLRDHFTRQFQTIKSTVASLVGALATDGHATGQPPQYQQQQQPMAPSTSGAPSYLPALSQSAQEQLELATKRLAEDKHKRKAIISPEYVQYGSATSSSAASAASSVSVSVSALPLAPSGESAMKIETQVASQVPDPTGRRPSKKTLHHTAAHATHESHEPSVSPHGAAHTHGADDRDDASAIRCKCTGKCRNARCACVKAGFVCGVHCKCVSCANPFVPMASAGIDIQTMVRDVCLMQFLSKVKDMHELLESRVPYDCCGGGDVQVKFTVERGFACPTCATRYTYSWCSNRLCNDAKKPRKHCAKCRRCGDHRNEHCDECNHCYFAGVANSFSCSCKGGKTSSGGSGSGGGVKARAVVPNSGAGDALRDGAANAYGGAKAAGADSSSFARDENSAPLNQSSLSGAAGSTHGSGSTVTATASGAGIADGLSSSEAEKDDACPVQ